MAGFYQVSLTGTAAGQDIRNLLYYSSATPDVVTFDASEAEELGQAVLDAYAETFLDDITSSYTLQGCEVKMVNEDGVTISPYTVSVVDPTPGAHGFAPSTVAQCLIVKFNCEPATLLNAHPVPKRSYVAVGPLSEVQIDPNGSVVSAVLTNMQVHATAALTGNHLIGLTEFLPYRVGRTTPAAPAGVGRVVSAVARPFSSFRRSRLVRPTGN